MLLGAHNQQKKVYMRQTLVDRPGGGCRKGARYYRRALPPSGREDPLRAVGELSRSSTRPLRAHATRRCLWADHVCGVVSFRAFPAFRTFVISPQFLLDSLFPSPPTSGLNPRLHFQFQPCLWSVFQTCPPSQSLGSCPLVGLHHCFPGLTGSLQESDRFKILCMEKEAHHSLQSHKLTLSYWFSFCSEGGPYALACLRLSRFYIGETPQWWKNWDGQSPVITFYPILTH